MRRSFLLVRESERILASLRARWSRVEYLGLSGSDALQRSSSRCTKSTIAASVSSGSLSSLFLGAVGVDVDILIGSGR